MKTTLKDLIMYLWFLMVLWIPVSMFIQAIYCSEMTQTEVLLNIINSLTLNFNHC